jgi:aryl-alcohol dehydrogenase-like predicted oxidoreductase
VLDACEAEGIGFVPWNPLGESLREPAYELRWLLDRSPVMLPLPGTSSIAHLEENMQAVA